MHADEGVAEKNHSVGLSVVGRHRTKPAVKMTDLEMADVNLYTVAPTP
jgi:hypothetical protein